jgi:ribosomal protein S18 acetylase RimI-like enzyme
MENRDAVTYLLLDEEVGQGEEAKIAGYFALSAGQVLKDAVPLEMGKRAPEPIPAVRMGRFAIDNTYQGQGLGAELLREALLRAVHAGALIGARVMLVDAISEAAFGFYRRFGFTASPIHPLQVVYDLRTVALSAGIET